MSKTVVTDQTVSTPTSAAKDSDNSLVTVSPLCFKVALYTKGSKIYEPTSQYGNLNIL